MRCQDIERLILDADERELSQEERRSIEQHLDQCAACGSFRDLWEDLQASFQKAPAPGLPSGLEERVRLACHEELSSRLQRRTRRARSTTSAAVPWPIWAALAVLTVLTAVFLVPGIEEFLQNQKATLEAVLVLGLILQNALMLFFAPVIIRRRRVSRAGLGESE
jgi:anti-sigma factor RsiW